MVKNNWFPEKEFRKLKTPCSLEDMCSEAMKKHNMVRDIVGVPMVMTSAFRNRGTNSAHDEYPCTAIDYLCEDSRLRMKIVEAAIKVGFRRIGIGENFVHLDLSKKNADFVMWHYY